jgi:hypothetical protein
LFGALVWQTQNKGLELAKSAQRGASILLPEMLDWNVDVLAKSTGHQLWNNRYRKPQNAPAVMVVNTPSKSMALHFELGTACLVSIIS